MTTARRRAGSLVDLPPQPQTAPSASEGATETQAHGWTLAGRTHRVTLGRSWHATLYPKAILRPPHCRANRSSSCGADAALPGLGGKPERVDLPDLLGRVRASPEAMAFDSCEGLIAMTFLGDPPLLGVLAFENATPIIYRKPESKGWGDTFGGRPVKLISEKP